MLGVGGGRKWLGLELCGVEPTMLRGQNHNLIGHGLLRRIALSVARAEDPSLSVLRSIRLPVGC